MLNYQMVYQIRELKRRSVHDSVRTRVNCLLFGTIMTIFKRIHRFSILHTQCSEHCRTWFSHEKGLFFFQNEIGAEWPQPTPKWQNRMDKCQHYRDCSFFFSLFRVLGNRIDDEPRMNPWWTKQPEEWWPQHASTISIYIYIFIHIHPYLFVYSFDFQ